MNNEEIKSLLTSVADFIPQASAWEQGFFESVKSQFDKKHTLSVKQIETVQKIAAKFSPEALREREAWYQSFGKAQRETMLVCARYYAGTSYFRDLVEDVLDKPNEFIPTPKQFKAMTENKYAIQVLENWKAKPQFPVGSLVTLRKNAAKTFAWKLSKAGSEDINALVLTTDEPILSAARGSKRYKLALVGSNEIVYAEQRDLKKIRKVKKC